MNQLARLALATSEIDSRPSLAALAWLAGLTDLRWQVQHFRSRACPTGAEAVGCLTGLPSRHLDSWLMPEDLLRALFHQGSKNADFAIVEGSFTTHGRSDCGLSQTVEGLMPIVEALDLPVVAVLSLPETGAFHLPRIPEEASAVFVENLRDRSQFEMIRSMLALTSKKPLLGGIERLPDVEAILANGPLDRKQTDLIFSRLSKSFVEFADLPAIRALARSRPTSWTCSCTSTRYSKPFRVAYARDCAFGGYFPDTLEALQAFGADLVEFSPLHDEHLPKNIDLVMIGCGYPDKFLHKLVNNLSLIGELQAHVCGGKRIYAEGGGAAYLGRCMVIEGKSYQGAGILPFDAELREIPSPPSPVVRILTTDTWLGPAGTEVRGYDSGRWRLRPETTDLGCCGSFGSMTLEEDVYYRHHAVGGMIHLHLGALKHVISAFACEHSASLSLPLSRPST